MKTNTKLKIVNWVKKVLHYRDFDFTPYIVKKELPIIEIHAQEIIEDDKLNDLMKYDALYEHMFASVFSQIKQIKAMKVEYRESPLSDKGILVKATLNIIMPYKTENENNNN
jgi:hypothetical protein